MSNTTKPRRSRRRFDDEFKAGATRLVLDEGQTVGRVARDLDLTESALRVWVDRARADRTKGRTGLTSEERDELRRLRKDNRQLQLERDVLKRGLYMIVPKPTKSSLYDDDDDAARQRAMKRGVYYSDARRGRLLAQFAEEIPRHFLETLREFDAVGRVAGEDASLSVLKK